MRPLAMMPTPDTTTCTMMRTNGFAMLDGHHALKARPAVNCVTCSVPHACATTPVLSLPSANDGCTPAHNTATQLLHVLINSDESKEPRLL